MSRYNQYGKRALTDPRERYQALIEQGYSPEVAMRMANNTEDMPVIWG